MSDWDRVAAPLERMSLLTQLRDKVRQADRVCRPRCGWCFFWMKRSCPKERNVNGMSRGPSCEDRPCEKFTPNSRFLSVLENRYQEAIEFAERHGLPVPEAAKPEGEL